MTQLSNTPAKTETDLGPVYYDTAIMLWTAENLIKKLLSAQFVPGHHEHKALTFMACRARDMARDFLEMEFYNIRQYLKDRMLRCRRWRMAVLQALGGERALTRWEERKALAAARRENPGLWPEAHTRQIDDIERDDIYVPVTRSLDAPDRAQEPEHPLDISIFRLARIKTGRNPHTHPLPIMALRTPGPRAHRVFARIELTPGELRHGLADTPDIECAEEDGGDAVVAPYSDIDIRAYIDRAMQDYLQLIISLQDAVNVRLGPQIPP